MSTVPPVSVCPRCQVVGVRQEKNTQFGERYVDTCGNGCLKEGTSFPLTIKWIPKTGVIASSALPPLEPHAATTVPAELSTQVTFAEMWKTLQELRAAVAAIQKWRYELEARDGIAAPPPAKRTATEVLMNPPKPAPPAIAPAAPQLWSDPFSSLN